MSSSKPTRWIVLDDTSPEFTYLGESWFAQTGIVTSYTRNDSSGNIDSNGQLYRGTTHGTRKPASFSVSYTGAQFEFVGTVDRRNNQQGLEWHCFVDGREVQNNTDINKIPLDNNWFICGDSESPSGDGTHTLVANISATTEQPFWFDWMRYTPIPNTSLENRTIRYDRSDPAVLPAFSSEWDMGLGETKMTGATFELEFIGVSFSWYGTLRLASLNLDPPSSNVPIGTYQIDNGPKHSIDCPVVPTRANSYNQKFFETESLPMGKHKISVIYTGGVYPFSNDFVLIQNGTLSDLLANTSDARAQRARRTTAIAASVASVVAVVFFVWFAWFLLKRKRRHREQVDLSEDSKDTVDGSGVQLQQDQDSPIVVPFSLMAAPLTPHAKGSHASLLHVPPVQGASSSTSQQKRNLQGLEAGGLVVEPEDSRRMTYGSEAPPRYTA